MSPVAEKLPPPSSALVWAVLLLVPALSFLVGGVFLPQPQPAAEERKSMDRDALEGAVTRVRPKPGTPAELTLGDELRFLGATLPEEPVGKGRGLTIDFFFETLAELDRDWQMFVHIDRRDGPYRIHGDHFPVDGEYNTSLWQKGEFVRDRFEKLVPFDAPEGTYDVFIGFYVGDERMSVSGDKSKHDGSNRIRAGTIKVK